MKKHIKIYNNHFNIEIPTDAKSELSDAPGQAVHHIQRRGMGGSKDKDRIENLMCLTHNEHEFYGDKQQWKAFLYERHKKELEKIGKPYDANWMNQQIAKYEPYRALR